MNFEMFKTSIFMKTKSIVATFLFSLYFTTQIFAQDLKELIPYNYLESNEAKKQKISQRKIKEFLKSDDTVHYKSFRNECYDVLGRLILVQWNLNNNYIEVKLEYDILSHWVKYEKYHFKNVHSKDSIKIRSISRTFNDSLISQIDDVEFDIQGKIKSQIVTEYIYNSNHVVKETQRTLDKKRKEISRREILYDYQNDLKLKKVVNYYNKAGSIDRTTKVEYIYDELPLLVKEIDVTGIDTIESIYKYNDTYQLVSKSIIQKDTLHRFPRIYGYDRQGNPINTDSLDYLDTKYIYDYDNFGNKIKELTYFNLRFHSEHIYKFNTKNRIIEQHENLENELLSSEYFTYDKDELTLLVFERKQNLMRNKYFKTNFIYNSDGFKMRETSILDANKLPDIIFEYELYKH